MQQRPRFAQAPTGLEIGVERLDQLSAEPPVVEQVSQDPLDERREPPARARLEGLRQRPQVFEHGHPGQVKVPGPALLDLRDLAEQAVLARERPDVRNGRADHHGEQLPSACHAEDLHPGLLVPGEPWIRVRVNTSQRALRHDQGQTVNDFGPFSRANNRVQQLASLRCPRWRRARAQPPGGARRPAPRASLAGTSARHRCQSGSSA